MTLAGRTAVGDDEGSAVAEFVLVAALLTLLTLSVIQLALALYVRTTLLDAASEGARYAALAGNGPSDGAERTRDLIESAIGPVYASHITAAYGTQYGFPSVEVRVRAPLPLLGLLGFDRGVRVVGHAAVESLD
ncbi:TadE/TadG family type IV pilus assembly protein [Glaciibacter psychrotolerans]|uniref:TadE-like domain-containing protein n=1 Tax=Glaciibacter psychrotolerans TaxID=670054 RepID=A0A7Z0EDH0_9MICO|nr:hypothetical protein [Leifsonia psychrotolerans]